MKKIYYKKNEKYLFVDGYNIINSWERLKTLSLQNLEDTRQKLMDEMSEFAIFTGEKVILVFDGYMVKKSPGVIYKYKGIIVVYTREFETADHFIERELHEIGRVRQVRVATSDNIEQQMILSRGGTRISSREFEMEVEIIKNSINKKSVELKNSNEKINTMDDKTLEKLEKLRDKID